MDQRSEGRSEHTGRRGASVREADLEFDHVGIDARETGLFEERPDHVDAHREGVTLERSRKGGFGPGGGELVAEDTKGLERVPLAHTATPATPPGRKTRRIPTAAARAGKNCRTLLASTTSKEPSSNGRASADASRQSIGAAPSGAPALAARASIGPLTSLATTCPSRPARRAAARATTPVPLAISSTRLPGAIPTTSSSTSAHGSNTAGTRYRSYPSGTASEVKAEDRSPLRGVDMPMQTATADGDARRAAPSRGCLCAENADAVLAARRRRGARGKRQCGARAADDQRCEYGARRPLDLRKKLL